MGTLNAHPFCRPKCSQFHRFSGKLTKYRFGTPLWKILVWNISHVAIDKFHDVVVQSRFHYHLLIENLVATETYPQVVMEMHFLLHVPPEVYLLPDVEYPL